MSRGKGGYLTFSLPEQLRSQFAGPVVRAKLRECVLGNEAVGSQFVNVVSQIGKEDTVLSYYIGLSGFGGSDGDAVRGM
jgi:hypothetical protein